MRKGNRYDVDEIIHYNSKFDKSAPPDWDDISLLKLKTPISIVEGEIEKIELSTDEVEVGSILQFSKYDCNHIYGRRPTWFISGLF